MMMVRMSAGIQLELAHASFDDVLRFVLAVERVPEDDARACADDPRANAPGRRVVDVVEHLHHLGRVAGRHVRAGVPRAEASDLVDQIVPGDAPGIGDDRLRFSRRRKLLGRRIVRPAALSGFRHRVERVRRTEARRGGGATAASATTATRTSALRRCRAWRTSLPAVAGRLLTRQRQRGQEHQYERRKNPVLHNPSTSTAPRPCPTLPTTAPVTSKVSSRLPSDR